MSTGTWEAHLNGTIEVHGMKLGSGSRFKEVGDSVKFSCSGGLDLTLVMANKWGLGLSTPFSVPLLTLFSVLLS